ncbi:hypothetical protein [Oligoflexus tunisiensis]|uniref:hypothetical protein n=1 Tax=Oligoflexus tunisiensis TaxID=708132 RepID=UPI00114D3621|nr:hypothetical protein [Oligoflexus tunisiensis]
MRIIRSLVMLTLMPCLVHCSEPLPGELQNTEGQNPLSCPGALEAPDIALYHEADATDTNAQPGLRKQFVVTALDSACAKRQVLFEGCGEESIQSLFGYYATRPRVMSAEEIRRFDEGDRKTVPAFTCSSDFTPLQDQQGRPAAIHAVSGKGGYGAMQIGNPLDVTRPTYVVAPNSCFALNRKLNIAKWAAQLERPEDAILIPFRPEADALTLQFSCAHEKKSASDKEGWVLTRSVIGDSQTTWFLRYLSKEPGKSLYFMIYRLDGQESFSPEQAQAFEQQMSERLGIKLTDITFEPLGSPEEKTLLLDYCTSDCETFQPQHMDLAGEPILMEAAGDSRLHLVPVSNPFLDTEFQVELTGRRAFKFRACEEAIDDFKSRLGFQPVEGVSESWENRLKKGAESTANFEMIDVPCFQKKPVCVRSIPAGTDLSTSMTNTPGSVSSYISRPSTGVCSRASELELRLEGDAFVRGNALTLGNTSRSHFTKITLTGNPQAKITLALDCNRITCDQQTLVAVQAIPNTLVELKGLQFATIHDPLKMKTVAVRGLGTGAETGALRVHEVNIGGPEMGEFHTGLWLENITTYAASLKVQSVIEAIHGQGGQLALIGRRRPGEIRATDALSLKVIPPQKMEPGTRRPSLNVLRVLNLTDVRSFLYATQLDGPMAMELQNRTEGPWTTTSWYMDVSNSYALYQTDSTAILTKGPQQAHFYFPWVHDVARLISFGGSNKGLPQLKFDLFVESSFVLDRDTPIENDYRGQINGTAAGDLNICRDEDNEDGYCFLSL